MSAPFPPYEPSQFAALSAEEVVGWHLRYVRKAQIIFVVVAAMIMLLYLALVIGTWTAFTSTVRLVFVLVVGLAMIALTRMGRLFFGVCINKHFMKLLLVLDQDCDAPKYLQIIELLMARDKHRRGLGTLQAQQAYALYCEELPQMALDLTALIRFKQPSSPGWFQVYTLQAACWNRLENPIACNAVLEEIAAFRDRLRPKTLRSQVDQYLRIAKVQFADPCTWTNAQANFAREQMSTAPMYRSRVSWALLLARYEISHEDFAEANTLMQTVQAGPLTPAGQANLDECRKMLEEKASNIFTSIEQ